MLPAVLPNGNAQDNTEPHEPPWEGPLTWTERHEKAPDGQGNMGAVRLIIRRSEVQVLPAPLFALVRGPVLPNFRRLVALPSELSACWGAAVAATGLWINNRRSSGSSGKHRGDGSPRPLTRPQGELRKSGPSRLSKRPHSDHVRGPRSRLVRRALVSPEPAISIYE